MSISTSNTNITNHSLSSLLPNTSARNEKSPFLLLPIELRWKIFECLDNKSKVNVSECCSTLNVEIYTNLKNVDMSKACKDGNILAVKKLLHIPLDPCKKSLADPTENNSRSLQIACENGHLEVVQALLQDGRADPTANNSRSLQIACENGHLEVVQALLQDRRADPTVNNNQSLITSCKNGHAGVVEALLQDGRTNPTRYGNYALFVANKENHTEVIEVLQKDIRVNPRANDTYIIRIAKMFIDAISNLA